MGEGEKTTILCEENRRFLCEEVRRLGYRANLFGPDLVVVRLPKRGLRDSPSIAVRVGSDGAPGGPEFFLVRRGEESPFRLEDLPTLLPFEDSAFRIPQDRLNEALRREDPDFDEADRILSTLSFKTARRLLRRSLFRQNPHCAYCGIRLTTATATLDHVVPISRGGGTKASNVVLSCRPCNNKKADRTPEEAGLKKPR